MGQCGESQNARDNVDPGDLPHSRFRLFKAGNAVYQPQISAQRLVP